MNNFGMVRVTTVCPKTVVANPDTNATEHIQILKKLNGSDIVLFPECSITGYTCGDLFHQNSLLKEAKRQLIRVSNYSREKLTVVGLPMVVGNSLYNCAAVLNDGKVIGIVPKETLPTYGEFYEGRWFDPACDPLPKMVAIDNYHVPFGTDLLFQYKNVTVGVEICEAIFTPIPPSSFYTVGGANIILNPSASPENIGKSDYRKNLVVGQSGRGICAYAYASAGPTESTSDLVFGGHLMIAEDGHMINESKQVGSSDEVFNRKSHWISSDVDVEQLQHDRQSTTSFNACKKHLNKEFRICEYKGVINDEPKNEILRKIDAHPFVPSNSETLDQRCKEVLSIQVNGLIKRLESVGFPDNPIDLSIGISGGLDSTLSLIVACYAVDALGVSRDIIKAKTMHGFGTTGKTFDNSKKLMNMMGVHSESIDIRELCFLEMQAIKHKPFGINIQDMPLPKFEMLLTTLSDDDEDLVFENIQARRRTELLMNTGFTLGTGDMSELFLGWCTYNGDHQSMYNVNCGVPKTLVKFLVGHIASQSTHVLKNLLKSIVETEISPELLPAGKDGEIKQSTEEKIGPYELHDFTMYYMIRHGMSPKKILWLMDHAEGWDKEYSKEEKVKWMRVAIRRFFSQQFKRNDVPDGPKIGSVALSPRGDWRMPSDACCKTWLNEIEHE